jgi:hypothetical protein
MESPNLFRHSLREGGADLWNWSKGHIATTAVSLFAAFLGIPVYLLFAGATVAVLQEQLAQVAAYSAFGPVILIAFAYVYFCLRAPYRLYARRIEELRDLRIRCGESIDDLEEPLPEPNRFKRFFTRYSARIVILFLLCVSGFLFYAIMTLGRVLVVNNLAVKSFQADAMAMIYLDLKLADKAVHICDENKLKDSDCNSVRAMDRKLNAAWPFRGHLPKSLKNVGEQER